MMRIDRASILRGANAVFYSLFPSALSLAPSPCLYAIH